MKQALKLIGINLVVIGFLLSLLNLLSITVVKLYNYHKPAEYAQAYLFPNYRNIAWARQHFIEYDHLTEAYYKAFYGWRRPAYHGQTINIDDDGLRRTLRSTAGSDDRTIAFFGGSTMWGVGVNDDNTIASLFSKANPGYAAINFGETGYVAHQSLNRFLERYFQGFHPDVVVFYDGVNEVASKCLAENDAFSHLRESQIREALQQQRESSYLDLVEPVRDLIERARRTLDSRQDAAQAYDCDQKPDKAEQVARVLLSDWMIVKKLVEGYGGEFIAVLQPEAYDSRTRLEHLDLDAALGRQYEVVYPIIAELREREFPELTANFVDLRTAVDGDAHVYIDWCHLSPNGNAIIARRIGAEVAERHPVPATALR
jgi:hypothetical protein